MKDELTLSIRIHDPKERLDHKKSTRWIVLDIPRADLDLSADEFTAKYGSYLAEMRLISKDEAVA